MTALRAAAQIEAENANLNFAQALEGQAKRLRDAGNGIESDIDRADLQISEAQLALQQAQGDLKQAKLALLRTMRQDLTTELDLTDKLAYVAVDPVTLSTAKLQAEKTRPDLWAQKDREQAARLGASASRAEQFPSLVGFADYGTTGNSTQGSLPTFTLGVSLRVPVYDGGRRRAQAAESSALARETSLRRQDLDDQIDYDLRTALERLDTADQQVKTATEGLSVAGKALDSANRRYAEGLAGSIEVTDAQTRLARAQNSRIAALFSHNLARLDLSRAMGSLVEMLSQ
jgi:outer membrane protein TolC